MSTGGDQPLTAARDAPVGGQAVLEGVMMRGVAQLGGGRAQAGRPRTCRALGGDALGAEPALGEIAVALVPAARPLAAGAGASTGCR